MNDTSSSSGWSSSELKLRKGSSTCNNPAELQARMSMVQTTQLHARQKKILRGGTRVDFVYLIDCGNTCWDCPSTFVIGFCHALLWFFGSHHLPKKKKQNAPKLVCRGCLKAGAFCRYGDSNVLMTTRQCKQLRQI